MQQKLRKNPLLEDFISGNFEISLKPDFMKKIILPLLVK